jgi:hypothetical protein
MGSSIPQRHGVKTQHFNPLPTKTLFFSLIKQEISGTPHQKSQTLQFCRFHCQQNLLFKLILMKSLIGHLIKQEISGKENLGN